MAASAHLPARRGVTTALAALAVLVAATDTYVVVLALPEMMAGVGLGVDELQRAAPIVSVFLLGYVALLPLVGRLSDLYGRVPVLVCGLLVFAAGSLVTAVAADLTTVLVGRFLQGVGGGGLVPVTLALVADVWDERRRGVPLGLVGAGQELGAVLGPLVGAAVLAVADWRAIFVLNVVAALVLAVALRLLGRPAPQPAPSGRRGARRVGDRLGILVLTLSTFALMIALTRPSMLAENVTLGWILVPTIDQLPMSTPAWLAATGLLVAFVLVELRVGEPLVDLQGAARALLAADVVGGLLVAVLLGGVVLSFATADPSVQLVASAWPWFLGASVAAGLALVLRRGRVPDPLLPPGTFRLSPAWGSLVVSLLVGVGLVVVLVDVPVLVRLVVPGSDQWDAAWLLLRFLVALPVGAVLGGLALRRLSPRPVAVLGLVLATAALGSMARWDQGSLVGVAHHLVLASGGLGFGLAVAPVNAALLAAVPSRTHGVGSAVLVAARMAGMLVGLAVLTGVGLRRANLELGRLPGAAELCGPRALGCDAYTQQLQSVLLTQVTTAFLGATICLGVGTVLAGCLLGDGPAPTRHPHGASLLP